MTPDAIAVLVLALLALISAVVYLLDRSHRATVNRLLDILEAAAALTPSPEDDRLIANIRAGLRGEDSKP